MNLNTTSLEFLFHPRSVALAGVTVTNPEHWTRTFFESLVEFGCTPLYPVNPKGGEIDGYKIFLSLKDIPGNIDYVISTVPARVAPSLVQEGFEKGVKAIHFCTSGFAETGEEEGIRLEAELKEAGRRTGIRLIGPNCMGIYCPTARLSFQAAFPKESGPVSFISQSGGNATGLVSQAMLRGVRFSKVISYGNACDLNESDYLEYLTDEPETSIICLYVEGIRDGNRFSQALQRAAGKPEVLLIQGGVTEGGARATAGHTGSLAGSEATWDALCRQLGVIRVHSMDEMTDILVTLLFLRLEKGRRAGLIGFGGGASVLITDKFEKTGLKVPLLPQKLRDQIRAYTHIAGNILRNPIDYSQTVDDVAKLSTTASIVSQWDGIDFVVGFLTPERASPGTKRLLFNIIDGISQGSRAGSKPMGLVVEPSLRPEEASYIFPLIQRGVASGLPVYFSFDGVASAINTVLNYYENRRSRSET